MYLERHDITLSGSTGAVAAYSNHVTGRILKLHYPQSTDYNMSTGATVTVTLEDSEVTVMTSATLSTKASWLLRELTHKSSDETAATDREPFYVAKERVKFNITSGSSSSGVTTTGLIHMWVG